MTAPQVVERGDGVPPYRARLAPSVVPVKLCGYGDGLLVLRCHDRAVADGLLVEALAAGEIPVDVLTALTWAAVGSSVLPEQPGEEVWVRWVPDDPHAWTEAGAWERELRGTVGATPALLYAARVEVDGR